MTDFSNHSAVCSVLLPAAVDGTDLERIKGQDDR
jgi:hypothetical protein